VSAWRTWLVGALWLALLGLWTYGLLSPSAPEELGEYVPEGLHFYAGKGLHVFAYAVLAFGAAWLPTPWRWATWVGLVLHAGLTEWLQPFVGRGGSVWDVLIDCGGITLGVVAAYCLIPTAGRPHSQAPPSETESPPQSSPSSRPL
jgi:VanZ family protein